MEYTHLGRTGLSVSRLCLGTMNFGPYATEADSHAIMDQALELGLNFFDTANVYGRPPTPEQQGGVGYTEEIIGRWLAQGGRRERIVLATKVYGGMWEGQNGGKLSAYHIRRACDDSLKRLQTDHIDLYQMHHVDRDTPWEEIWQAMELLVGQGKVLYVGSSNFAGWHLAKAQAKAQQRQFLGLVSEQSIYNLRNRYVELEVLPAAQDYGLGVIPWSPLGGGLLAGVLERPQDGRRARPGLDQAVEKLRPQLEQWEQFCTELGEEPAQVALAWVLSHPAVTAPIIGPRTAEQLSGSLRALAIQLDATALERLDEIWPAPGTTGKGRQPSPEAYAW